MHPLAETWRRIIVGEGRSWVVFANGTCVILMNYEGDPETQAMDLMREWGPVHVGSSAGDFGIVGLPNGLGWVVTGHHNDTLTYVSPDEVGDESSDLTVGMLGSAARTQTS